MKEDTMLETRRPKLDMLSESFIDQILSEALDVLGKTGVLVENDEALRLLADAGCECKGQTVLFKENLVEESLKTTPHSIKVYDRSGDLAMNLEGDFGSGDIERKRSGNRGSHPFCEIDRCPPQPCGTEYRDDFHRCPKSHAGQVSVIHRTAVQQETGSDWYFCSGEF
jgi:hypothetical protein